MYSVRSCRRNERAERSRALRHCHASRRKRARDSASHAVLQRQPLLSRSVTRAHRRSQRWRNLPSSSSGPRRSRRRQGTGILLLPMPNTYPVNLSMTPPLPPHLPPRSRTRRNSALNPRPHLALAATMRCVVAYNIDTFISSSMSQDGAETFTVKKSSLSRKLTLGVHPALSPP